MNYNKYENYIRVGHNGTQNADGSYSCSDLEDFPTPAALGTTLHDTDKDPFTDLQGYTHRNRVRHDVIDIELNYSILSDDDIDYILNRIGPEWIYMELIDKKKRSAELQIVDGITYIKYRKINPLPDENNVFWYNPLTNTMYTATLEVVTDFNMSDYYKVTHPVKTVHKVYASDKAFDTFKVWKDGNGEWHELKSALSVSFVEE